MKSKEVIAKEHIFKALNEFTENSTEELENAGYSHEQAVIILVMRFLDKFPFQETKEGIKSYLFNQGIIIDL